MSDDPSPWQKLTTASRLREMNRMAVDLDLPKTIHPHALLVLADDSTVGLVHIDTPSARRRKPRVSFVRCAVLTIPDVTRPPVRHTLDIPQATWDALPKRPMPAWRDN